MRLAYCTGMRRWPCSRNTTPTMIARPNRQTIVKTSGPLFSRMLPPSAGMRAAMLTNISSDMPLPMPRSVISSPNHMITAVPAVIVSTMMARLNTVLSGMIGSSQSPNRPPRLAMAMMPVACRTARPMVR